MSVYSSKYTAYSSRLHERWKRRVSTSRNNEYTRKNGKEEKVEQDRQTRESKYCEQFTKCSFGIFNLEKGNQ